MSENKYNFNNYPNLNDLTIIVPTSNRNYYLSRCLSYISMFNFKKIIIADSSSTEKKDVNKRTISKINCDIEIEHLEYPVDTEKYGGDIYRKWADAVNNSDTKYTLICTDKEFTVPSTLNQSIEFLKKNSDYNVAEGRYYYIESSKENSYRLREMYPSKISLIQDNPLSRLKSCNNGKNISTNQLALRRTDFYKKLYATLYEYDIDDLRFGEFSLEFLTIIKSKCIYFDKPFCFRDISNLSQSGTLYNSESSSLRYPYLDEYISNGVYDEYFNRFMNCMISEIQKENSYDETYLRKHMPKLFTEIIKKRKFFGNRKFTQDPLWYLWRHSPDFVKDTISSLIPNKYLNYTDEIPIDTQEIINIIDNTKNYFKYDKPIL